MVVSVRGASGLPVGDPTSRKCHPYVILTVVENCKQVRFPLGGSRVSRVKGLELCMGGRGGARAAAANRTRNKRVTVHVVMGSSCRVLF